ncbi:MAG: fibronectin type III domain-containing protein [Bdellovibrio sp.]
MKIFVALFTFALTLTLTLPSLAEEKAGGGGHENLPEKMNSLFPQPQPQLQKREVPAKPELTAPAFNSVVSGDKVLLQWNAVPGVEEYHVQVATDPNFKWIAAEVLNHKGTSFEAISLGSGKTYFWRVAGVKPQNWSTFRKGFFSMSSFKTAGATK